MARVFDTQDHLEIRLYYTETISGIISDQVIKYIDPDGVEGSWTAAHNESAKYFYYTLPQGSPLGKAGYWTVWSYLTMDDGRVLPGEKARFRIFEE